MPRIGVFICHCGENIAGTVDAAAVAQACAELPGVVHSVDYKYMCSDPGQNLIKEAIKEKKLTGVVVAACSPRMHEPTFRRACAEAGLNPFLCEMANLREHCSWVHEKGRRRPRRRSTWSGSWSRRSSATARCSRSTCRSRRRRWCSAAASRASRPAWTSPTPGTGHPGRARPVDRRAHGPAFGDVPDAGLLAVHPDAADGRGRPAPEHHAVHVLRAGEARRLHRQLQGDDPQEGPRHRREALHRLRRLHAEVPDEEDPQRVQRRPRACGRRSTSRSRRPCRTSR